MWSFLFHYILAVHRQIRLGQKGKNEKCWKSTATEGSVCAIQSDYYRGEKLFDRWVERKGGGDEKPQEQEKRMTSPFCHSCELAPLCFMEIGIDEDTRVTKNRESSVMSSMYGHAGSISTDLKLIKTPLLQG